MEDRQILNHFSCLPVVNGYKDQYKKSNYCNNDYCNDDYIHVNYV